MFRPLLALLTLAALTGCAIEEADFPDAYGKAVCKKARKCDRADYEEHYDDLDVCIDDAGDLIRGVIDLAGLVGQEYVPEYGRDCVSQINGMSCEDYNDGEVDCDLFE